MDDLLTKDMIIKIQKVAENHANILLQEITEFVSKPLVNIDCLTLTDSEDLTNG